MNQDYKHPITSPLELSDEQVGEWLIDDGYPWDPSEQAVITITTNRLKNVARQAFQAGADQELKACCEWLDKNVGRWEIPLELRDARRPKPPSLKEQALKMLRPLSNPVMPGTPEYRLYEPQAEIIRRALEALDD